MVNVGDRIRLSSTKGPDRDGVVTAVTGSLLRVRWSSNDETTLAPAPGTLTVLAATETVKATARTKKAVPKKTATPPRPPRQEGDARQHPVANKDDQTTIVLTDTREAHRPALARKPTAPVRTRCTEREAGARPPAAPVVRYSQRPSVAEIRHARRPPVRRTGRSDSAAGTVRPGNTRPRTLTSRVWLVVDGGDRRCDDGSRRCAHRCRGDGFRRGIRAVCH